MNPAVDDRLFLGLPAPAKLNLFLHVTGRRADGYHELQSVFVPVGLADRVDLAARDDGRLERSGDLVGPAEGDLALRAAAALQAAAWPRGDGPGAAIHVLKRIPAGSGLGGGSSDAATTLIGLNRLWRLDWPHERLAALALRLGADVPFFLQSGPCFAEGIGEQLSPLDLPMLHAVIVHPPVHVATAGVFGDPALTRDTERTTIAGFSAAVRQWKGCSEGRATSAAPPAGIAGALAWALPGRNDLEPVVRRRWPQVAAALDALARVAGAARLTGSGAAGFALFADPLAAAAVAAALRALPDAPGSVWSVPVLEEHPLAAWRVGAEGPGPEASGAPLGPAAAGAVAGA